MTTAAAETSEMTHVSDVELDTGPEEGTYVPAEPTKDEVKAANAVLKELKAGRDLGDEAIIDALLQIVDVLPQFTTHEAWALGEEVELAAADVVENIAKYLCDCRRITLRHSTILFLFRNKDKWMDGDRPKRGQMSKMNYRSQYSNPGKLVWMEVNFHHWLTLNPLQKIQTVYRLLRECDEDASSVRADFTGYMDELELFGLRTFHELVALEHSLRVAVDVTHPHQLSLWEQE